MRKTSITLMLSIFAVLAVPALAAGPATVPTAADVPADVSALALPAQPLQSANLSLSQVLADPVATAVGTVAWGCPYGAPTCTTHAQCDAYCGAPGFGQCEFAHWSGCCVCLG